ncbi:MAG: TonB-dependent receptor [Bryobacteraceae bacterium]|nr:TonB-dependent receptor [Bryobacteraceae bacterium]
MSRYNQYGGSVSGPVWIPKLYDGRNRVFFFFGYEGIKDSLPAPVVSTVPTAAQKGGDFSALLASGNAYQIYDPATGVREGARVRRLPFAGNVIPANRISPIARNYLSYYPAPNQAGLPDGQDNLLSTTSGERNDFFNYIGRMDVNISDRHKLFAGVRHNQRVGQGSNNLNQSLTDPVTSGTGLSRRNWGIMADDVYTFSPTLMLNSRANWTRFSEPLRNFTEGFDSTSLGFPAYLAANSSKRVVPRIRFSRYTGFGDTGGTTFPFDSFQLFESVTKILSKHSLKFGADIRQQRESQLNFGFSNGDFLFGTNWTQGPLDNAAAAPLGQDMASFLLGLPTDGVYDNNTSRQNKRSYYGFFFTDDYRVSSNLTLNLGLRAEHEGATTERYNRSVNGFDDAANLSITAAARAAYALNPIPELSVSAFRPLGGLTFASNENREIYSTASLNFSPRVGFAWKPDKLGGNTVIRGGAGVYYFVLGINGANQLGFSQATPVVPTLDGFLTPAATLANPFPNGFAAPSGSSLGVNTFLGRAVTFYNPDTKNPYSVRWNLSISRQLGASTMFEIGYMGNKAVRLGVDQALNGIPVNFLSTSPTRDQATINTLTANVANPYAGLLPGTALNGGLVARNQLLRRYSQFPSVTAQALNDGSSHFHALQARIERRFSGGLQLTGNFQYSKLIEKRSRLNDLDPLLEKRIAAEDRPWRLVTNGSYDLPFGRGKRFGGNVNRWANLAVGEWTFNAIYTLQPGAPLTWGNVIYFGGPLNIDPHNPDIAFDRTRFNRVAAQQLDFNLRTFPTRFANLRQDGVNQLDFSVIKGFKIGETVNLTYRCEFFNSTNRPIFSAPQLAPTNTNFGVITNQANQPRRIQMALRLVF